MPQRSIVITFHDDDDDAPPLLPLHHGGGPSSSPSAFSAEMKFRQRLEDLRARFPTWSISGHVHDDRFATAAQKGAASAAIEDDRPPTNDRHRAAEESLAVDADAAPEFSAPPSTPAATFPAGLIFQERRFAAPKPPPPLTSMLGGRTQRNFLTTTATATPFNTTTPTTNVAAPLLCAASNALAPMMGMIDISAASGVNANHRRSTPVFYSSDPAISRVQQFVDAHVAAMPIYQRRCEQLRQPQQRQSQRAADKPQKSICQKEGGRDGNGGGRRKSLKGGKDDHDDAFGGHLSVHSRTSRSASSSLSSTSLRTLSASSSSSSSITVGRAPNTEKNTKKKRRPKKTNTDARRSDSGDKTEKHTEEGSLGRAAAAAADDDAISAPLADVFVVDDAVTLTTNLHVAGGHKSTGNARGTRPSRVRVGYIVHLGGCGGGGDAGGGDGEVTPYDGREGIVVAVKDGGQRFQVALYDTAVEMFEAYFPYGSVHRCHCCEKEGGDDSEREGSVGGCFHHALFSSASAMRSTDSFSSDIGFVGTPKPLQKKRKKNTVRGHRSEEKDEKIQWLRDEPLGAADPTRASPSVFRLKQNDTAVDSTSHHHHHHHCYILPLPPDSPLPALPLSLAKGNKKWWCAAADVVLVALSVESYAIELQQRHATAEEEAAERRERLEMLAKRLAKEEEEAIEKRRQQEAMEAKMMKAKSSDTMREDKENSSISHKSARRLSQFAPIPTDYEDRADADYGGGRGRGGGNREHQSPASPPSFIRANRRASSQQPPTPIPQQERAAGGSSITETEEENAFLKTENEKLRTELTNAHGHINVMEKEMRRLRALLAAARGLGEGDGEGEGEGEEGEGSEEKHEPPFYASDIYGSDGDGRRGSAYRAERAGVTIPAAAVAAVNRSRSLSQQSGGGSSSRGVGSAEEELRRRRRASLNVSLVVGGGGGNNAGANLVRRTSISNTAHGGDPRPASSLLLLGSSQEATDAAALSLVSSASRLRSRIANNNSALSYASSSGGGGGGGVVTNAVTETASNAFAFSPLFDDGGGDGAAAAMVMRRRRRNSSWASAASSTHTNNNNNMTTTPRVVPAEAHLHQMRRKDSMVLLAATTNAGTAASSPSPSHSCYSHHSYISPSGQHEDESEGKKKHIAMLKRAVGVETAKSLALSPAPTHSRFSPPTAATTTSDHRRGGAAAVAGFAGGSDEGEGGGGGMESAFGVSPPIATLADVEGEDGDGDGGGFGFFGGGADSYDFTTSPGGGTAAVPVIGIRQLRSSLSLSRRSVTRDAAAARGGFGDEIEEEEEEIDVEGGEDAHSGGLNSAFIIHQRTNTSPHHRGGNRELHDESESDDAAADDTNTRPFTTNAAWGALNEKTKKIRHEKPTEEAPTVPQRNDSATLPHFNFTQTSSRSLLSPLTATQSRAGERGRGREGREGRSEGSPLHLGSSIPAAAALPALKNVSPRRQHSEKDVNASYEQHEHAQQLMSQRPNDNPPPPPTAPRPDSFVPDVQHRPSSSRSFRRLSELRSLAASRGSIGTAAESVASSSQRHPQPDPHHHHDDGNNHRVCSASDDNNNGNRQRPSSSYDDNGAAPAALPTTATSAAAAISPHSTSIALTIGDDDD